MAAFHSADATCPAHSAVAVVPSDVTVIPTTRSLYIGTTGNLTVRMADGMTALFTTVPVGIFPIQVDMVFSTGTTAATIVALS
jgi:hypothetical protein